MLGDPRGLRHQLGRAGGRRRGAPGRGARAPLARAQPQREAAPRRARSATRGFTVLPSLTNFVTFDTRRSGPRGVPAAARARRDREAARPLPHGELPARLRRHSRRERRLPRRPRHRLHQARSMRANGLVVAIDGPSGAGKSTAGRALAVQLGYTYIDTGAMYRALALKASRSGVSLDAEEALAALLRASSIQLAEGGRRVLLDTAGRDDRGALARDEPRVVAGLGPPRRARRDGGAPARDGQGRRRRARRPRHRHGGVPGRRGQVLPRRGARGAGASAASASCARRAATCRSTRSRRRCASATTPTRTAPSRRCSGRGTRSRSTPRSCRTRRSWSGCWPRCAPARAGRSTSGASPRPTAARRAATWSCCEPGSSAPGSTGSRRGDEDQQRPHHEEEVYLVMEGRGRFRIGDQDFPAEPGALLTRPGPRRARLPLDHGRPAAAGLLRARRGHERLADGLRSEPDHGRACGG